MITTYRAAPDIDVVSSTATIADFGSLAINAFVMHGDEPLLVDTGAVVEADDFMTALRTVIDPTELRWIWLSHTDFDHIGSLHTLLDENPQLRVITTFFGMGIMGLSAMPLPPERVRLVNPGERVRVGNRTLRAIKPPVYDNAVTTGFYDETSRAALQRRLLRRALARHPAKRGGHLRHGPARRPNTVGHHRLALDPQRRSQTVHRTPRTDRRTRPRDRAQRPPPTRCPAPCSTHCSTHSRKHLTPQRSTHPITPCSKKCSPGSPLALPTDLSTTHRTGTSHAPNVSPNANARLIIAAAGCRPYNAGSVTQPLLTFGGNCPPSRRRHTRDCSG